MNNIAQEAPKGSSGIWNLFKIIVALILVGFIFSKTNIYQLVALKDRISWNWLALRFIFFCLMLLVKSLQYWTLFEKRIRYSNMLNIVIWQNAIANFLANSAGVASYLAMLRAEEGINLRRAGITFAITKIGDLFTMWLYLAISAWLIWAQVEVLHGIILLLLVGILLSFSFFFVVVLLRQKLISVLHAAANKFRLAHLKFVKTLLDFLSTLAEQEQRTVFYILLRSTTLSLIYMTLTMAFSYSGLRMFLAPLDFWPIIMTATLLQLLSVVPVQILGGLGITEVTGMYLYGLFGIQQSDIAAILLGLRAVFYLMTLVTMAYLPFGMWMSKKHRESMNRGNGSSDV